MELRPFQLIVLFIFGFLALVGVFLFASYSGFGSKSGEVGTVTIWGTLPTSSVKAGLDALSLSRKEFRSVGYVERPAATFSADLANALASGTGPDLVIITQEELLHERSKLSLIPFSSISQRSYVSTYLPIAELLLTSEGTYGIPYLVDPLVLYYNRTTLSAKGVASPPQTWEAVTGHASSLTERAPDQSIIKSAVALGEYGNIMNARAIVSLLLLQSGVVLTKATPQGMRATIGGELAVDSPPGSLLPGVSALNFYTQFANPVKTVYSWNRALPSSRQEFIAGDLALYIGFASERPFIESAAPNLDFDMAPIPQPGTAVGVKTYGTLYAFAIPRASKNPSGAFSAALGLSDNAALPSTARVASMAPAKRALLVSDPTELFSPVYYPAALSAAAWLSPLPSATDGIFATMISDITTGRQDTANAIRSAEQTMNAMLQ